MKRIPRTVWKFVNLPKKSHSGSYGRYYQISETRGVKILDEGTTEKAALMEFNILKSLEDVTIKGRRITPKPYCVARYKFRGAICYGIEMEHIQSDPGRRKPGVMTTIRKANLHFIEKGFIYTDCNPANILITEKGWKIIDFTPSWVKSVTKKKKKEAVLDNHRVFPDAYILKIN